MRVWRICRKQHEALDGEGARLYGGRWNTEGTRVVYTSSTLSLAALEYLIHMDVVDVPRDLIAMAIELPDNAPTQTVTVEDLPADWPLPEHPVCAAIGDAWIGRGSALILRVPSAIVPEESNVLINPDHSRARKLTVPLTRRFAFDPRLL